jgi:hypothetical protein
LLVLALLVTEAFLALRATFLLDAWEAIIRCIGIFSRDLEPRCLILHGLPKHPCYGCQGYGSQGPAYASTAWIAAVLIGAISP